MSARIRNAEQRFLSRFGLRRRGFAFLGLLSLVGALLVVNASLSSAVGTNGDPITFAQTECIAQVGAGTLGTPIDITVAAVVPNNVAVNAGYSMTFPGGTTTLPSESNGFTIDGYHNLNQTYLFRSSSGSPTINTAVPAGNASNNGNPVSPPYNATFTNEGTTGAFGTTQPVWTQTAGGTITYTTAAPHTFQAGQLVDINGMTNTQWAFSGVVVASVPSNTTFTIHGTSVNTPTYSWTGPPGSATLTYNTAFPSGLNVGDSFFVFNAVPNRFNGKRTVTAVLSPTQFQAADGTAGADPGPSSATGIVDTLANPGGTLGTLKGGIKSLTTVTLSTPSATPGTLTVPDTNLTMTAPNANATVTTYSPVVLTTAHLVGPGDAATVCLLPHATPQADGISATLVGTGGPTTTSQPSCRPDVTLCPPAVATVSPNSGTAAGGTSVTITGEHFDGATAVSFGGTPAASFTVSGSTSITTTAPAHAAGTVDVTVTGPGGTSATGATDQFTYTAAPTVTSVSPNSGSTGGGTSVTIAGTDFTGATAVNFGATPAASFTVDNATQITAVSPAHAAGTVDVTVTTPGGTSATSVNDQYTFVSSPAVSSVSPTSGPTAGGTSVTITGANFTGATAVSFGATPAASFTVNNATQITAVSPAHTAGTVDITVTTPAGTSSTSANDEFTFVAAPTVTNVSPASGPAAGGTSVTITGTNFTGATAVSFGATPAASFTVDNATQITAVSPAHAAGTVDVRVTTAGGTSATSANDQFTFVAAPTVTNVSPSSGPAAGGTSVTITGTNFTGATAVSFGATPAASFTVDNATQITAVSPAHAAGTVDVRVTTVGGTSATSANDQFTFVAAPTVTNVNPNSGPAAGGTSVIITGTNFTGATAVSFGATPAASFTVNNATQITAVSPAHAAALVDVTVTTVGGTSATSANDQFTFIGAPTVASVSPSSGPTAGGTSVTITGSGFTGATAVSFGVTPAASFTVNNDTTITATSPAHAAGTVDVTVTTTGGTSATSANDQFTFVAAPTVTSVSPNTGPDTGGTSVTITGTGFNAATSVSFGATLAASFTINNDTSITATSPNHAAGTVDVTVTSPGGTSATSANDEFTFTATGGGPTVIGSCEGQVVLGTPKPLLTDVTQTGVKISGALAAIQHTTTKIGGTCSAPPRTGDPHIPPPSGTLHPKAEILSLLGNASCSVPANDPNVGQAYPLNGKVTWTMTEQYIDPVTNILHSYKIQAAIAVLGMGENGNGPDVADIGGIVLTGLAPGARVTGTWWQDPVTKTGGSAGYNTGYELDTVNSANCADATPGNASITKLLLGGGGTSSSSLIGSSTEGVKFELGE